MAKENDIQNSICEYLSLRHYFFWRNNTVGVFDATKKIYRAMPKYAMSGVADILLLKDGLFVAIEVKAPKGKQSENQKEFERLVKANGGAYIIATSIEDVIKYGL